MIILNKYAVEITTTPEIIAKLKALGFSEGDVIQINVE